MEPLVGPGSLHANGFRRRRVRRERQPAIARVALILGRPSDGHGRGLVRGDATIPSVTGNARVRLPAIQTREGAATVSGYEPAPSTRHLEEISAMLGDVAERVAMPDVHETRRTNVRLTMTVLPVGMPMQLFYFSLTPVDDDGEVTLPLPDEEIAAVFIANQPLPVVREVALRFLLDLVARSVPVDDVVDGRRKLDELPDLIAESEAETGLIAWETLSYDWTRATDVIRERAAARGMTLGVQHTPDVLATREELARRLRPLRRLYREEERVRHWVDHAVAGVAGGQLTLRGGGERARLFVQQQTMTAGLPQLLAQALRDGYVCGNGYLRPEMTGLDMGARCLRPEAVAIRRDGTLVEHRTDGPSRVLGPETMHFRGVEQLRAPYGASALEPLLFVLQHRAVIANSRAIHDNTPAHLRGMLDERFGDALKTADAMEDDLDKRLQELTGVVELLPREIPDDLYLPGQESL